MSFLKMLETLMPTLPFNTNNNDDDNDNTTVAAFAPLSLSLSLLYALIGGYIFIEICFYIAFSMYFVPRANEFTEPPPYRDYQRDRCKLLLRIVSRIEKTCDNSNNNDNDKDNKELVQQKIVQFLTEWFQVRRRRDDDNDNDNSDNDSNNASNNNNNQTKEQRLLRLPSRMSSSDISTATTPSTSPDSSDTENFDDEPIAYNNSNNKDKTNDEKEEEDQDELPVLSRSEVDEFFGWAFFGKRVSDMLPWEQDELNRLYVELERETGVSFPNSTTTTNKRYTCIPRCMSLEKVKALYRPLFVYGFVLLLKFIAGVFLYMRGFRRYTSQTGLVGWYRLAQDPSNAFLPTIFFHGIAPGGLVFYLPMVLFGLVPERDRSVFLFENPSISCCCLDTNNNNFHPLTEEQTVDGVIELLTYTNCFFDKKEQQQQPLSLIGHSFGSCPITWLIMSKKIPNIRQVTLLDPVAILLSEPDVMVNFLYAEELNKIRMVASSELFTEYYLRRHFAWYNSELWLEDVLQLQQPQPQGNQQQQSKNTPLLVCLSEEDEIVNTSKVSTEMKRLKLHQEHNLVVWPKVGHAACVTAPNMWKQIKERMVHHELQVMQQQQQQPQYEQQPQHSLQQSNNNNKQKHE